MDFPDDLVAALGRKDSIPKSVLLEIARNDDRETRMALLRRVQTGHLTVREARNAKANPARKQEKTKASIKSHRFQISRGKVIIKIAGYVSIAALKSALQEALGPLG